LRRAKLGNTVGNLETSAGWGGRKQTKDKLFEDFFPQSALKHVIKISIRN